MEEQHRNCTKRITSRLLPHLLATSIVLSLSLLSQSALAHGNETHVIGTVKSISDDSITVTTTDGKTQEVRVNEGTLFERSGHSVKFHDISVGDRVVIHAAPKNGVLIAHTVKVGALQKGK